MSRFARKALIGALVASAFLGLLAGPVAAQARTTPLVPAPAAVAGPSAPLALPPAAAPADSPALQDTVVRVMAKVAENAQTAASLGALRSGTGVLIDQSTVLTIGYLLLEADEVEVVTASGRRIPASVADYDAMSGFGLVRSALPLDGQPLELGDSDAVVEMQRVLTLGHGEAAPTELLVVSRKPFAGSWEYMLESAIFTFPPVNNWSGSALISDEGRLVGIGSLLVNDAANDRRGVPGNLFVPINLLKPILQDLLANGRRSGPAQPWLGVSTEVVQGHLIVAKVTPGGPADLAGLAAGDIIVGVGAEKVDNQTDFYRHVWNSGPAGVTVPLRVLKSGDVREVAVRTTDRMSLLRKPRGV